MPDLPIISRARAHADAIAFRSAAAGHSYQQLLDRSQVLAAALLGEVDDLKESRVALLVPAGFDYVAAQWAIWRAGGVKAGYIHGATNDLGVEAIDGKVHIHDLHATMLHLLGLDHEKLTYRYGGRDFRLTDVKGRVVREILA